MAGAGMFDRLIQKGQAVVIQRKGESRFYQNSNDWNTIVFIFGAFFVFEVVSVCKVFLIFRGLLVLSNMGTAITNLQKKYLILADVLSEILTKKKKAEGHVNFQISNFSAQCYE